MNNTYLEHYKFVTVIDELSQLFPELDLRFNLLEGSTALRCITADFPCHAFDILLGIKSIDSTIEEAAVKIRRIAGLLDA